MSKHSGTATARLRTDYLRLKRDPVPFVTAEPLPSNILEWHYVVQGPDDSPYTGGYYHGKLVFPMEYPFRPPSIYMMTPSGRFKTNTRLCLSISDFHPDTWNPAWSVSTILTGLLSFMIEKSPTFGSIETSDYEKREWAVHSLTFNLKNKQFVELFPFTVEKIRQKIEAQEQYAEKMGLKGTEKKPKSKGSRRDKSSTMGNARHLSAALTNLVVLIGFGLFAWAVKYVITSVDNETL